MHVITDETATEITQLIGDEKFFNLIHSTKKLPRHEARKIITHQLPELSPESLEDLLLLYHEAPQISTQLPNNRFPARGKFAACAWLCGASWRMLGASFGVTASTVRDGAFMHLMPAIRSITPRLREYKYSAPPHTIDKMKSVWIDIWNTERHTLDQDTISLARILLARTDASDDSMD